MPAPHPNIVCRQDGGRSPCDICNDNPVLRCHSCGSEHKSAHIHWLHCKGSALGTKQAKCYCTVHDKLTFYCSVCHVKSLWLTMRLFQLMYHCHTVRGLGRAVNHLRTAVRELVGLHHSHPGPVRVIDIVLKQSDAKGMWDHGTSVDDCFPIKHFSEHKMYI